MKTKTKIFLIVIFLFISCVLSLSLFISKRGIGTSILTIALNPVDYNFHAGDCVEVENSDYEFKSVTCVMDHSSKLYITFPVRLYFEDSYFYSSDKLSVDDVKFRKKGSENWFKIGKMLEVKKRNSYIYHLSNSSSSSVTQ